MAFPSENKLHELIDAPVSSHGLDVEAIRVTKAGRKSKVDVRVDGDGHPDLDLIEVISNELSAILDSAEEAGEVDFGAGYTLEVSTPGVDAPLTKARHWRRNRGRLVVLTEDGAKTSWRIGALNADETKVALLAAKSRHNNSGKNRERMTRVLNLAEGPEGLASGDTAVVEIEFAVPAPADLEWADTPFDDLDL